MNDKQALESFLDFNATKPRKSDICFEDVFMSPQRTEDEKILQSFKQLRAQLKVTQRENEQLNEKNKISEIKLSQTQEQLQIVLQNNYTTKAQLKKESQSHQQLKQKFSQLKETFTKTKALEDELHFTKQSLLESKLSEQNYLSEKAKIMQISLNEKLNLEQQISRLTAKSKSDENYLKQIENQIMQTKSLNIKLENQLRKFTISHEQQTFNKQWSRENFQTQHLLQKIDEIQKQASSMRGKYKKEKEKRIILQQKLLEFQQLSGVNQVKAEAFQSEAELLMNRQAKLQKKIMSLTKKLQSKKEENLLLSTKLANLSTISQEFVCRAKAQKIANLLECVFEFEGKLKHLTNNIIAASTIKQSTANKNNLKQLSQKYYSEKINTNYLANVDCKKTSLSTENNSFLSRFSFGFEQFKENQIEEYSDIENKIRRERDQMERRIKQKYMQKKIQTSMPSEAHKIRSDYITTFVHRR